MRALLASAVLLAVTVSPEAASVIRPPAPGEPIYLVEHVDVLPDQAARARDAISGYVETSRREPGALRIEAMREIRQNHFDIVEVWRDEAAFHVHEAGTAALRFRAAVATWLASPTDERMGTSIVR